MARIGKLIGRGAFTKVYEDLDNPSMVLVHTCDPQKELYAMGWIDSEIMPTYHYIDSEGLEYKDGFSWYTMERLTKVKAWTKELKPEHVELYRSLRLVNKRGYLDLRAKFEQMGLDFLVDVVDNLINWVQPEDLRFEISPRNVGLNSKGDLVLLDCFYDLGVLRDTLK